MSWQELFPLTSRINSQNHLELGGCDVESLAREFGTPLYVFDELTLREQARRALEAFRTRWRNTELLYATKAFFAPFLAQLWRELGLGLDVTSEGEMVIARRAGFDPDRIYVHGNNKTPAEICAALDMGITHFVVDNIDEIAVLADLAPSVLSLLIRLSPDVDAHTHRYMTTGVADSKFGLGIANGAAERARDEIARHKKLVLVGLHFHIGSQVFDSGAQHVALGAALELASAWKTHAKFELRELDLGGGWGVAYNESQLSLDVDSFAANAVRSLEAGLARGNLDPQIKLLVEPGRALVARAAVALYRVGSVKEIEGIRTYVAVDGGMGDNIRPALYGARYQPFLGNRMNELRSHEYAIAGRYCEQGDLLIEHAALPPVRPGDLIAMPVAGAYQLPMASNYNLIPRPALVLVRDGQARLVRRRETIDDMLAGDL